MERTKKNAPQCWRTNGAKRKENEMREVVSMQIRIPSEMHDYVMCESNRIGISQNAFLLILLEQGKKLWASKTIIQPEE